MIKTTQNIGNKIIIFKRLPYCGHFIRKAFHLVVVDSYSPTPLAHCCHTRSKLDGVSPRLGREHGSEFFPQHCRCGVSGHMTEDHSLSREALMKPKTGWSCTTHAAWVATSVFSGSTTVPSRYPKSWAPRTVGMTCAFHRRKFSRVSFSEMGWSRLEGEELLHMATLGSDYHVKYDETVQMQRRLSC
jgi:hypothetical protein